MHDDTMTLPQTIDHYVVIVSNHNIAELRACLFFRPKLIHMIVTKSMTKQAERFAATLQKNGLKFAIVGQDPNLVDFCQIITSGLTGDRFDEIHQWIESVFQPYTVKWCSDNQVAVLNMSGGTKTLSLQLLQSFQWSQVHYMPFLSNAEELPLEVLRFGENGLVVSEDAYDIGGKFDILDGLRLYCDLVKESTQPSFSDEELCLMIANQRLEAQINPNLLREDNLFPQITPVLEKLWYKDRIKAPVFVVWDEFRPSNGQQISFDFEKSMYKFIKWLYKLMPIDIAQQLDIDEKGVFLPPFNKKFKPWCQWIGGGWFEFLIQTWAKDMGVPRYQWRANVYFERTAGDNQEVDFLLLKNNQLHFIEIKTDIPDQNSLKKYIEQVLRQSDSVGFVKRCIVFSPAIKHRTEEYKAQWQHFEQLCAAKRIDIKIAFQPSDLQSLLGSSKK